MLSWTSEDDLFDDEGVIESQVEKGSGWRNSKQGDKVLWSWQAEQPDGTVVAEKNGIEYTLGSDALGPVGEAVNEVARLKSTKDYAYGDETPDGDLYFLRPGGA